MRPETMNKLFGYPVCLTLEMDGTTMSVPGAVVYDKATRVSVDLDVVLDFIDQYQREHPFGNGNTWENEGGYCG